TQFWPAATGGPADRRGLGGHHPWAGAAGAGAGWRDPDRGDSLMSTDPVHPAPATESPAPESPATESRAPVGATAPAGTATAGWTAAGLLIVLALAAATRFLEQQAPGWFEGGAAEFVEAIEYPVYAIALGLLGSLAITLTGIRDRVAGAFRTEFFIKTGLVLLGASVNLSVIVSAAGPALLQALSRVTAVV